MTDDKNVENKPCFDLERAETMINKRVLIGLTYYDHKGAFLEQKQMHGTIISVDQHRGFEIALEGSREGEIYMLPPDLRSFHEAPPGEYHERSTGETIINPDFTTTWVINKPPPDFKSGE
jgi:hypothetical protein